MRLSGGAIAFASGGYSVAVGAIGRTAGDPADGPQRRRLPHGSVHLTVRADRLEHARGALMLANQTRMAKQPRAMAEGESA